MSNFLKVDVIPPVVLGDGGAASSESSATVTTATNTTVMVDALNEIQGRLLGLSQSFQDMAELIVAVAPPPVVIPPFPAAMNVMVLNPAPAAPALQKTSDINGATMKDLLFELVVNSRAMLLLLAANGANSMTHEDALAFAAQMGLGEHN